MESMSGRTEESERTPTPLVFLSHDSRDMELAHAFAELIRDCSGGGVQTFMSSDHKGTSGLEYGADWYNAIMDKIDSATDVVALLTQRSLQRPWILYEVGVAKGKLGSTVFGLALGIPLTEASSGPFAVFQNCGDDADSLTKLLKQLVSEERGFAPREKMIRSCVAEFKVRANELTDKTDDDVDREPQQSDQNLTARQFEEIKLSLRQIFERLPRDTATESRTPPSSLPELLHAALLTRNPEAWDAAWRSLKDAHVDILNAAVYVHVALRKKNGLRLQESLDQLIHALRDQPGHWKWLGDYLRVTYAKLFSVVAQDAEIGTTKDPWPRPPSGQVLGL